MSALQGHGQPDDDREADDVLSGVDSLVADGIADPDRLFLFGHSYGAYLLNRIVSSDHRFVAAVCWEGVADLRLLDAAVPGGYAAQRGLRGGSPAEVPERWSAASPVSRVDAIRTPMLLVYGGDSMGPTHGTAWFGALREHGVPCDLVIYEGEGHLFNDPANQADMFAKAAAWTTGGAPDEHDHLAGQANDVGQLIDRIGGLHSGRRGWEEEHPSLGAVHDEDNIGSVPFRAGEKPVGDLLVCDRPVADADPHALERRSDRGGDLRQPPSAASEDIHRRPPGGTLRYVPDPGESFQVRPGNLVAARRHPCVAHGFMMPSSHEGRAFGFFECPTPTRWCRGAWR